jgi:hypothetical protein
MGLRARIPEPSGSRSAWEPIAVKPVIDELPLLKLGGKKPQKLKQPDMWTKQAPAVRRYEARSARLARREGRPARDPQVALAVGDAEARPRTPSSRRRVDELQPDAGESDAEATVEGEGSPAVSRKVRRRIR